MARCFNCGKNFDYEKYYGICPKCGSYNRENTPEEEHKELHEQYDSGTSEYHRQTVYYDATHGNANGAAYHTGYGTTYSAGQGAYGQRTSGRAKPTAGAVVIFIALIIGIVATIAAPFIYVLYRGFGVAGAIVDDIDSWAENNGEVPAEALARTEQSAEFVPGALGEPLYFGKNKDVEITVTGARVRVPAGYLGEFPKGENLVSISISHKYSGEFYEDYSATDEPYVGFGEKRYRLCLESYDMEPYLNALGNIRIVDKYSLSHGEGEGELLVFVPQELTSLTLYLESRDEDTYELLEIYEIPLEIAPGEEV